MTANNADMRWCFSQVKGALDDDVSEADIISCVEFNEDGDLLATGDKGGRVVIFQRDQVGSGRFTVNNQSHALLNNGDVNNHNNGFRHSPVRSTNYNVYSTFQSHEAEFDYLKSLEIEEKINKIKWLKRKNPAHFLLSTNDKTVKLWKVSERDKQADGYNLRNEDGILYDSHSLSKLKVPVLCAMDLMVEASPRRVFANAHTYSINSISVNSDGETFLSADDLRVNLWHTDITDQSFNIVDTKPQNMEDLTEVITSCEFHPYECNMFVYSSSKGSIRLCDMRSAALCDSHAQLFEDVEEDESSAGGRSFFSEIITSISDVKWSHSGRYLLARDYLTVKVWDTHMTDRPVETYHIHDYLGGKLCNLYENDCIFDKFECAWRGDDSAFITGSYNNFFRVIRRQSATSSSTAGRRGASLRAAVGGKAALSTQHASNRKSGKSSTPSSPQSISDNSSISSKLRSSSSSLGRGARLPRSGNDGSAIDRSDDDQDESDQERDDDEEMLRSSSTGAPADDDEMNGTFSSCNRNSSLSSSSSSSSSSAAGSTDGGTGGVKNIARASFPTVAAQDLTFEAARDVAKPNALLKLKKVSTSGVKRKKDEVFVDCLDFSKRVLHMAWHPTEDIVAVAATNNLFLFHNQETVSGTGQSNGVNNNNSSSSLSMSMAD